MIHWTKFFPMNVRGPRRTPVVPITAPTFAPPSHAAFYRRIAYTFFGLTALILVGILWLSSVEAQVDIRVRRTPVRGESVVEITPQPAGATQIAGRVLSVPVRKTQEFEVRGVAETVVAGTSTSATVGNLAVTTTAAAPKPAATPSSTSNITGYARGQVTIINNYSKSQTLVEKTRLITSDNKLYRIDRRVVVPAGDRVTVTVTADQPGDQYAIGPMKFTIPGLWIDLQKLIFAESSEAFSIRSGTGGAITSPAPTPVPAPAPSPIATSTVPRGDRKIVTQQNLDEAYESLTQQVVEQAKKLLLANMNDARFTGAAYFVNTTAKSATVRPGQTANTFTAQVDVEVIGVFYSADDMQQLIRSRLREKLPEGQEFLPFNEQNFVYVPESVDKEGERARLRVITNAEYRLVPTTPALASSNIAGKSKNDAERYLKEIEGVEAVDITLKPGWIGKIPRLTDRIKMDVK